MKILAIGSVEDAEFITEQIKEQTVQPTDIKLFKDPDPKPSDSSEHGINQRRIRIAENQAILQEYVRHNKPDLVWQVEQDSVLPADTLERLLSWYYQLVDDKFGYISGVQLGRHGVTCIGAWHVAVDKNSFMSLDYKARGLQTVDATGLYCLLAKADVWLEGSASWNGEAWGPDVNFGLSLKEKGYSIYCDTQLQIGHKVQRGVIDFDNRNICRVEFTNNNGKWKYTTS